MQKLKRDDEVIVTTGRDKGKHGRITKVLGNGRLLITGINMVKRHTKPNPNAGVQGGIIEKEASIAISNVSIFNPKSKAADKVGFKVEEDGSKTRIYKSDQAPVV